MSDIVSGNSSDNEYISNQDSDSTTNTSSGSDESSIEDPSRFLFEERIINSPELPMRTYYNRSSPAVLMNPGDVLNGVTRPPTYKEGSIFCIPIVLQINLIPEEIRPIPSQLRNIIFKFLSSFTYRPFGACYKINQNNRTFGTIAKIYDYNHSLIIQNGRIAVMGQQRFEVLEVLNRNNRLCVAARIKIIKDIALTNPYNKLCLNPKKHYLDHSKMRCKRDMLQTQWPTWVYKQFDVHELASRISKKVKMLDKNIDISKYDPTFLSFLVTRLGIFNEAVVSKLLSIESTYLRLQHELQYLNDLKVVEEYICAGSQCRARVCNLNNVFPMSLIKPHRSYCEYWRTNTDMIFVSDLDDKADVITFSSRATECHCFLGYKSTSIFCRRCKSLLGWSFLMDRNMPLMPMLFYGLSVTALIKTSTIIDP